MKPNVTAAATAALTTGGGAGEERGAGEADGHQIIANNKDEHRPQQGEDVTLERQELAVEPPHLHASPRRERIDGSPITMQTTPSSFEEAAVLDFKARCPSVSTSTAIKFLAARKFSVDRAVELLRQHEAVRLREGLTTFQPTVSPLKEELETAKFTVLPWRDQQGAAITMFTAGRHSPSSSTHRITLAGVVYQLDVALDDALTQRDGIVFVYNMVGSRYEHFDYELCQKILQLLKGAYPARLKKVLIVGAPLWFRAPFKILRLFVREKLRDRVMIVSQAQLVQHIPESSLPLDLGGSQPPHDHQAWLMHCLKVHNEQIAEGTSLLSGCPSLQNAAATTEERFLMTNHTRNDSELPLEADCTYRDRVEERGRNSSNSRDSQLAQFDENNCPVNKHGRQQYQQHQDDSAGNGKLRDGQSFRTTINTSRNNGLTTQATTTTTTTELHNSNGTGIRNGDSGCQRQPVSRNSIYNGQADSGYDRSRNGNNDNQLDQGLDHNGVELNGQQKHTMTPDREDVLEEEGDDSSLISANSAAAATAATGSGEIAVVGACWLPGESSSTVSSDQTGLSAVPAAADASLRGFADGHPVPNKIAPPVVRAPTPPTTEPSRSLTMEEFILDLQKKGRKGLCREYAEIKSRPPAGTFDTARDKMNQCKNRYTDVLCLDHSRVRLPVSARKAAFVPREAEGQERDSDDDLINPMRCVGSTDYINANFVDGYAGERAFISTQGPLPRTFGDFWRMVWEEKCGVIVMTTRCVERSRTKCGQYWPLAEGEEHEHGDFHIANQGVEAAGDFQVSELQLSLRGPCENSGDRETTPRTVWHLQFLSWPDYGVPDSAFAMLSFRDVCLQKQHEVIQDLESRSLWSSSVAPQGPPIVVHCSAGIGRTGTFITLDTCIRRLESESRMDVRGTVEAIRAQRAFSIQMPDQYVFCHLALLEYALIHGHLNDVDLAGFDDSTDESADEQH